MLNDKLKEFMVENFKGFSEYDDKLYNELCRVVRESLDLKFYLYRIGNKRISRTPNMLYYKEEGIIELDSNRIYNYCDKLVSDGTFRSMSDDLKSSLMLRSILQMVRYIVDFKNLDEGVQRDKTPIWHSYMARLGNFDLEMYINSRINMNVVDKIFYHNTGLYPHERIAKVQSLKSVIDVYKEISNYDEEIMTDLLILLLDTKISDYSYKSGVIECPIYKFYSLLGHPEFYSDRLYSCYSLDERIEMGMPISYEELVNTVIETLELNPDNKEVRNFARTYVK